MDKNFSSEHWKVWTSLATQYFSRLPDTATFSIAPGSSPGFIALIVNIALVCYLLAMKMIMIVVMSKVE